MNVTQLSKATERNSYGDLAVDFEAAIHAAYPEIMIDTHSPGCWGANPDCWLSESSGSWTLDIPDGRYSSTKHRHTAGHSILAVESSRKKLNLAGCPLFLISGRAFNGDYRSLTKTYFLFGKNEDGSFFCHKVRPNVGSTGDLEAVRAWVWSLKKDEVVAARQGDVAFIPKRRASGKVCDSPWCGFYHSGEFLKEAISNCPAGQSLLMQGNHAIYGEEVRLTANKAYVLNPVASHGEHNAVALDGWHEVRMGKAWGASSAD